MISWNYLLPLRWYMTIVILIAAEQFSLDMAEF